MKKNQIMALILAVAAILAAGSWLARWASPQLVNRTPTSPTEAEQRETGLTTALQRLPPLTTAAKVLSFVRATILLDNVPGRTEPSVFSACQITTVKVTARPDGIWDVTCTGDSGPVEAKLNTQGELVGPLVNTNSP